MYLSLKCMRSRIVHKGDITNLFCINNDQFLISFSVDGCMHINQLGSMQPDSKMDSSLPLVILVSSSHKQSSLDEILRGFTETETEQVVVNDDLKCNVPLFMVVMY